MKPILALLLIVNLLACPIHCVSCEASIVANAEHASMTTGCCSSCCGDSESPASDCPSPCSGGDCDCQNCICGGAVLEADVELPALEVTWFAWGHFCARVDLAVADKSVSIADDPLGFCKHFRTGRAARIGLQSLLI